MSKELVIASSRHETKVAILEDDQLVELYFQRAHEYSLAGSIHKGRVTRVLPGMQSAFVDLGLERDTFLYVSDFFEENGEEFDRIPDEKPAGFRNDKDRGERGRPERERSERDRPERERPEREKIESPSLAAVQAPTSPVSADPPAAISGPESADDSGDRRGRRSRRRRSRGRGFPESKYASGGNEASSAMEAGGHSESATEENEPDQSSGPQEVFLLPGESLAKYRNRPASPEEESEFEEPDDAAADIAVDPLPERSAESETVLAPALVPDSILADFTVEKIESAAAKLDEEEPAVENLIFLPDSDSIALPKDDDQTDEDDETGLMEAREQLASDLEDGSNLEFVELVESDAILAVISEDLQDEAEPDAPEHERIPSLLDEEESDAPVDREVGEAGTEEAKEPLTASVREGGQRLPHRGSRRPRRRGRGGERGDRGPERNPERGPESGRPSGAEPAVPAPAPALEVRSPHRSSGPDRGGDRERTPLPSITDLLREGQEIIVQIAKEPLGQKGARITSHIALPGRYVVYMPTLEHLGVSRKIASDEERFRLKRVLQGHRGAMTGGFIVRTAGEGHTDEEIGADMAYLYNLWTDIKRKADKRPSPALLHHDLDIVQRILRDQLNDMFKAIWCDNEEVYESILQFLQRFQPSLVGRVKMYTRPTPIFDAFNVTSEIEKALRPKVWLKSGGYIVINQTEALVAVDVNTGKYVGKGNRLEDTITKTNTEAVKEIVRQIRLRDLGGIIVVDFIDMDERKNRQKVMQVLEEAMRADRAPYKVLQFNDFGLVAITRKRVKQSLERSLCSPCPTCEGAAYVKSVNTVVSEVLQESIKIRQSVEGKNVVLRAHPDVAKFLKSSSNTYLEEIEEVLGRPVLVTGDPMLHPEKFDLAW